MTNVPVKNPDSEDSASLGKRIEPAARFLAPFVVLIWMFLFAWLTSLPATHEWASGGWRLPIQVTAGVSICVLGSIVVGFGAVASESYYWHVTWTAVSMALPILGVFAVSQPTRPWANWIIFAFVSITLIAIVVGRSIKRKEKYWVNRAVLWRTRFRAHWGRVALVFIALSIIAGMCSIVLGDLRLRSQFWAIWLAVVSTLYAFATFRMAYLALRFKLDQDLRDVGVSLRGPLKRMRRELFATQEQLRKLADELGPSVVELDEMYVNTQDLETRAKDAEKMASLTAEQQSAFMRNMERKWQAQNHHQAWYFLFGVIVTAIFAYASDIYEGLAWLFAWLVETF